MSKLVALVLLACLLALLPRERAVGAASAGLELARQLNEAFVEVAEKVSPSVVVITVVQKASAPSNDEQDENSPFDALPPDFRRYFQQPSQGQGSGVIIRQDGYILTNGHVVEDADTIEVRLKDGRTFQAKLRGADPLSDIAVIKIEAKSLPVVALADSSKTRVGEFAIAIGAPFSLDYSVTFGHISAKGRSNVITGYEGVMMDQDYIQTDALINPGNSGGPLVNIEGAVIGINTLIRGFHSGIGFAIPSNLAKEVADRLIAEGKFTRAWLGVEIRALRDDPDSSRLIKAVKDGVIIERILPGGPAAKSDLERNDIVTAVDGKAVSSSQQLRGEIRGKRVGQPVTLEVYRPDANGPGKTLKLKVSPAEWVQPVTALTSTGRNSAAERDYSAFGVTIHSLNRILANQLGVESTTNGVIVIAVEKDTPAARKGIKPGDIITSVNQESVANPTQFRDAVKKADLKRGVALTLFRDQTTHSETLKEAGE
jgi:serine protease Do